MNTRLLTSELFNELFDMRTLSSQTLPFDLIKTPEGVQAHFLMPGFEKEQINVYVKERNLIIEAQRPEDTQQQYLKKMIPNKVYYNVPVSPQLDIDSIQAQLNHGILVVNLVRKDPAVRNITIN